MTSNTSLWQSDQSNQLCKWMTNNSFIIRDKHTVYCLPADLAIWYKETNFFKVDVSFCHHKCVKVFILMISQMTHIVKWPLFPFSTFKYFIILQMSQRSCLPWKLLNQSIANSNYVLEHHLPILLGKYNIAN